MDKIMEAFLTRQHDQVKSLCCKTDILRVQALDGPPPQHYIVEIAAKGLVKNAGGQVVEAPGCAFGITLPDDYLRTVNPVQVLTYLGPARPWHPNIKPPLVCVHLKPGMPLVDLLQTCFEIWTWNLFYTGDEGLNHAASQWARQQDPSRFPIDRRPLRRRALSLEVAAAK